MSRLPFSAATRKLKAYVAETLELSRQGTSKNIRAMEGLRGVAAFIVFFAHFADFSSAYLNHAAPGFAALMRLSNLGNAGVDLFFVLSGFLIYASVISKPTAFVPYAQRRLRRIYPVFLVVFAVYLLASLAVPSFSNIPADAAKLPAYLAANLLLLSPLWVATPLLINVAWSLSYEMFYYLAAPLMVRLLKLRRWQPKMRVGLFVLLGAAYLAVCARFGGHPRLVLFLVGMVLYELLKNTAIRAPNTARSTAICVTGFALYTVRYQSSGLEPVLILLPTLFILGLACLGSDSKIARFFTATPLRHFGNMSYSFYLIHYLVVACFFAALGKFIPAAEQFGLAFAFGLLPLVFATAWLAAFVLFASVERPFSLQKAPANRAKPTQQHSPSQRPSTS